MKMRMRMIVAANVSSHYTSMGDGICNSVAAAHTFTHRMHALERTHAFVSQRFYTLKWQWHRHRHRH